MEKKVLFSKKTSKIAIFGGAFNPIHYGHLFIASEAISLFNFDKVIFVPTGNPNPAFKKEDLLDKGIRMNLCRIATEKYNVFEVSDYEVKKDTPSYYIETLLHFKKECESIWTILGEDAFQQIHRWKESFEIFKNTEFIIAERYEDNFRSTKNYIERNFKQYKGKIKFLKHPFFKVSSSFIRERIRNNLPINFLIPEKVEEEIIKNKYYQSNSVL